MNKYFKAELNHKVMQRACMNLTAFITAMKMEFVRFFLFQLLIQLHFLHFYQGQHFYWLHYPQERIRFRFDYLPYP